MAFSKHARITVHCGWVASRVRINNHALRKLQFCFTSFRELANQHSENLGTVLKHVIYNELSNARNPNNMALLGTLFQNNQEKAAKVCKKETFKCYSIFNIIILTSCLN